MEQQIETPPVEVVTYTTRDYLNYHGELWAKYDAAESNPSEQRRLLQLLREDTRRFNEETRRLP